MTTAARRKERAPFNREVLKWARERVRLSYDSAADGAGVRPEQVEQWEKGDALPTIKQGRKLANVYDLPFLELLSKEKPKIKELELVPDFRMHRDAPEPKEQYELLMVQSEAEEIRLNAIDLIELLEIDTPTPPENFYCTLEKKPADAAAIARAVIGMPIDAQLSLSNKERPKFITSFRRYVERIGVIVMKNSALAQFGARGLCLFAEPFPVIIFSSEAPTAQAFTLAHELAHVALKQSAISGPVNSASQQGKRVEDWCNSFAGAFLMPANVVAAMRQRPSSPAKTIDDYELNAFAISFCVSRHAALVRLVELGYVDSDFYWKVKRPEFLAQEAAFKGGGRSLYYGSRYRSSRGDLYTGLVLDAWSNGAITNHNAAEFMGIKNIAHLDAIRDRFRD
jgi:Zn-dependent peptidase ImmA (M78 family)/transcriptional regulator with XRE-family HTH domain